jgi:nitroimidazol reductase NimA-like FMN-containing flavoprotein (pyridoxamine 5'-phosphate oxidase superfamily)
VEPLPDALKRYIADAPVCRIATVRPGGAPHVIPVCPVFDGDATVYIDIGPQSATAAALRHEPRIAVLFDEYHDDWSRLRKVLLSCRTEEATGAERDAAWVRIREKFPQYAGIDWHPRQTMALRIQSWLQEGFSDG